MASYLAIGLRVAGPVQLSEAREQAAAHAMSARAAPSRPVASLDAERRFAQPHARLFPFLGGKVRTPAGPGTLIRVFADRCTVLLDSQVSQCAQFEPSEIEPVSWEVAK